MEKALCRIIEYYGDSHQARKLVEEILELQEELIKVKGISRQSVYEEISDVYVLLHQFSVRYDFPLIDSSWMSTEQMVNFDCSYVLEMALRLNRNIYRGISKTDCIKLLITEMHRLIDGIKNTLMLDDEIIREVMKRKIARTISRMEEENE